MNQISLFFGILFFVLGLCIGSFLNVVILRGLKGEDFVKGRSKCPKCGNMLKWYMNIPLLSYLFLGGKCAYCREKISIQYPIVEFIGGVSFLCSFLAFGFSLKTIFICAVLSMFIVLSVCDIKETVIIDTHAYFLLIITLVYSFFNEVGFIYALLSALGAFLFFFIINKVFELLTGNIGFGEGDGLIALSLGAIFGFRNFFIIFIMSVLIQLIFMIPGAIQKEWKNKNKLSIFAYLSAIWGVLTFYYMLKYPIYKYTMTLVLLFDVFIVLKSVKERKAQDFEEIKENFFIMPYGPALIISGTIGIFFMPKILNILHQLYQSLLLLYQ